MVNEELWASDADKEKEMVAKIREMVTYNGIMFTVVPRLNNSVKGMVPTMRCGYDALTVVEDMPYSRHAKEDVNVTSAAAQEDEMDEKVIHTKVRRWTESNNSNRKKYVNKVFVSICGKLGV